MQVLELVETPEEKRDSKWELDFLNALCHANLRLIFNDVKTGPDGCPYLYAETTKSATEPFANLAEWLSTRGIGLVINPHKEIPDYILTYGMIWYFKETGRFFSSATAESHQRLVLEQGTSVLAGPPSNTYLPLYVREILRQFFKAQDISAPKILVLSQDRLHFDLCVSLESLGNPPESEHEGIAELLGWFLPPHYSLVLISEKGLPAFVDL
ncbi:MAG TPA: hypothetical protein VFV50_08860 [Bdellovibrionales bacterium]|nr:hypothetical protein [Bdellovibrionales bacterium]